MWRPVVVALASVCGVAACVSAAAGELPACEWCGATEASGDVGWDLTLAPAGEPGERLVLEGTVEYPDGAPAGDAVVYVYQTNAKGLYQPGPRPRGAEVRHGALRGWIRPHGKTGRYRIKTIRPAPYPNRTEPAHVHVTVKQPGRDEYWLGSFLFADDPLLAAHQKRRPDFDASGVVAPRKDSRGTWRARRRIVLRPGR